MDIKKIEKAMGSNSSKKSRLSSTVESLLNKQIEIELNASQVYKAMAAWCEWKGYTGTAKFLNKHTGEERTHMNKLYHYMLERGALPKTPATQSQPTDFSNLKTVLTKALDHEIMVTASYSKACDIVMKDGDKVTAEFLRWYLNEQIEEEAIYLNLLDRLEIAGSDKRGEYFIDNEINDLA